MAEHEEHVVSPLIYLAVLIALMVLLALTLVAAFVDLDKLIAGQHNSGTAYWNMTVAILIAICKATLIILFFMHVKYGSRVTWAFAMAGFVWLGIMMTLSMSDYVTRNYPAGSPKSSPNYPTANLERPQPRHDAVVPGASAAPIRPNLIPQGHSFWTRTSVERHGRGCVELYPSYRRLAVRTRSRPPKSLRMRTSSNAACAWPNSWAAGP